MKYANAIAIGTVLAWSVGCASASKVVVQDSVGPCHRVAATGAQDGSLQVYSAREKGSVETSADVFLWNNNYLPAHTDYTIFAEGGTRLRTVRNSRNLNDERPTLVRLPAGSYTIQAEAEESDGIDATVVVPLVVEAGQITAVHLEPNQNGAGESMDPTRLVRLADGRIIGCRAQIHLSQAAQTAPGSEATQNWAHIR